MPLSTLDELTLFVTTAQNRVREDLKVEKRVKLRMFLLGKLDTLNDLACRLEMLRAGE